MNPGGARFWVGGRIAFPEPTEMERLHVKPDGSYHSLFGPCVAHSGVVYAEDNGNVSLASTRITKARNPICHGYEQAMQYQQSVFISSNTHILLDLALSYEGDLDDYTNMVLESELHHDDTHTKRLLRMHAWEELLDNNNIYDNTWHAPGSVTQYKMKKFEIAKVGKVPRMICDLGVACSLQGFRLTKFMKYAMANNPFHINGGVIEFIPTPTPADLERVFQQLIEPEGRFYFPLFSDDSCLSYRRDDGHILRFNVDISSCDASHTTELFYALKHLFPLHLRADFQQLIDQCQECITIYDLNNKSRKVVLEPSGPRLYSGSTLTTIINNLANILIGISISQATNVRSSADIVRAAALVGYIVTCEDCSDWHQLQFLKHSPVLSTDGRVRPLLNIGVLLRLSGTCKGDLPGNKKTPLRDRAEAFQASLLQGAYPHAQFTLLTNMRAHSGIATRETDVMVERMLEYKVVQDDDYGDFTVSSSEVWARYGLTDLEIAEIEIDFGCTGFESHYTSSGTDKVLELDYGLTGRTLW